MHDGIFTAFEFPGQVADIEILVVQYNPAAHDLLYIPEFRNNAGQGRKTLPAFGKAASALS